MRENVIVDSEYLRYDFRGKILLAASEQFEVKNSNACERVMIDVPWLEMAHNHDSSLFLGGKKVISDGKKDAFP